MSIAAFPITLYSENVFLQTTKKHGYLNVILRILNGHKMITVTLLKIILSM